MPGSLIVEQGTAGEFEIPVERGRLDQAEGMVRVLFRVERQCRVMPGRAVAVGVCGIVLLESSAVGEDDAAQGPGARRCIDRAFEAVFGEDRQVSGVVDVPVSENHRVDRRRIDRERGPVAFPELFEPLEQAAIDHEPGVGRVDQVARSGYAPGRSRESDLHWAKRSSGRRVAIGSRRPGSGDVTGRGDSRVRWGFVSGSPNRIRPLGGDGYDVEECHQSES